jgi:hypothetical protein
LEVVHFQLLCTLPLIKFSPFSQVSFLVPLHSYWSVLTVGMYGVQILGFRDADCWVP